MTQKRILLIIGGGIAAYKCLELIRRLSDRGIKTRTVMTKAAQEFITPLSVGALSNEPVFTDMFDLNDEREIGHIRLSRETDLLVVAPATADFLAKMAGGHANDLASTVLMATDKPVLAAPAMNPRMWQHPATQRNVVQLKKDGITFIDPEFGEMAESNEAGQGRLADIPILVDAIEAELAKPRSNSAQENRTPANTSTGLLSGRHVLVTAGPTHEPIDPVRFIANRSSGKQGYAIAEAARDAGANVTLITGPVTLAKPHGIHVVDVETAAEMLAATKAALPSDLAIFTAAVADWRVADAGNKKIKKRKKGAPKLSLVENTDILKTIASKRKNRPTLVIGFAAETNNVVTYATKKLKSKGADWIIANDVSAQTGIMGGDRNTVHHITSSGVENWPDMAKEDVAKRLIAEASKALNANIRVKSQ
ncbi:MAG: bifunctional phosphopantothenoylcysteine decarboxylase/phosphopantothenate--cysteine ligase CoaBC [Hyphomicrobiaceae bacterium]